MLWPVSTRSTACEIPTPWFALPPCWPGAVPPPVRPGRRASRSRCCAPPTRAGASWRRRSSRPEAASRSCRFTRPPAKRWRNCAPRPRTRRPTCGGAAPATLTCKPPRSACLTPTAPGRPGQPDLQGRDRNLAPGVERHGLFHPREPGAADGRRRSVRVPEAGAPQRHPVHAQRPGAGQERGQGRGGHRRELHLRFRERAPARLHDGEKRRTLRGHGLRDRRHCAGEGLTQPPSRHAATPPHVSTTS